MSHLKKKEHIFNKVDTYPATTEWWSPCL